MGFNLKIGEKAKEGNRVIVKTVKLKDAPADGVPTDYINERWPSYVGWTDFYNAVGLREMFIDDLLQRHPGWVKLTQGHKAEVDRAYHSIKLFPAKHQVRLEWLKFWVDWALVNCKEPIFYNS